MGPSLLIIVLHYSGLDDTLECLTSLGRQTYANAHTMLIDNGSAEKPGPRLAADYPWVEVVEMADNRGWSGGNNAAIRLAIARNYDFVCLLNNDTVLPANAIERLMDTAAWSGPCILHPAIDSYDVEHEVQLDPVIPQPAHLTATPVPERTGLFEISILNGACVCVHVDIFKQVGLIDDRFFLLCEDSDFGQRAVAAGYRLFCDSLVRIKHKESRSFGGRRKPIKTYYSIRNSLLYVQKHKLAHRSFLTYGRHMAWTVWHTAEAAEAQICSWPGLILWCLSSNTFARAVRMGVRDFLLRRFGRLNRRDEHILTVEIKPY